LADEESISFTVGPDKYVYLIDKVNKSRPCALEQRDRQIVILEPDADIKVVDVDSIARA